MDNLVCEFGQIRQLPLLLSCPGVGQPRQGKCQRLVVGPDGETAALLVVAEMSDGCINAKQLSVESTV